MGVRNRMRGSTCAAEHQEPPVKLYCPGLPAWNNHKTSLPSGELTDVRKEDEKGLHGPFSPMVLCLPPPPAPGGARWLS